MAVLVPVFLLGYLGARRLYRGRLLQAGFLMATAISTGLLALRFFDLIADWVDWFLD